MGRTRSEEFVSWCFISVTHTIQAKTLDTSPSSDVNSGGIIQLILLGTPPYSLRVWYTFFITHLWIRQLSKDTDVLFTINVGPYFLPFYMHESLIVLIFSSGSCFKIQRSLGAVGGLSMPWSKGPSGGRIQTSWDPWMWEISWLVRACAWSAIPQRGVE